MGIGRKKTICLLIFATALCIAVAIWAMALGKRLQVITLPDGRIYRFVGTTSGTNHSQPRFAARLADHLPAGLGNFLRRQLEPRLGSLAGVRTSEPSLCVWLELVASNSPSVTTSTSTVPQTYAIYSVLADQNGIFGGRSTYAMASNVKGVPFPAAQFTVVPRRSPALQCVFFDQISTPDLSHAYARVTFPNPLFGHFPQWKAEALPAVKKAGDVEVRLASVIRGQNIGGIYYFDAALNPPAGDDKGWVIHRAAMSDATGNQVFATRLGRQRAAASRDYYRTIRGALWPDEDAWKLTLELEHTNASDKQELITFKKVPIPPPPLATARGIVIDEILPGVTNAPMLSLATNTINGHCIVLDYFTLDGHWSLSSDSHGNPAIKAELPDQPPGVALDLVSAVTDTGVALNRIREFGDDFSITVEFSRPVPTNASSVDITFSVQKTRAVDFFFKPQSTN